MIKIIVIATLICGAAVAFPKYSIQQQLTIGEEYTVKTVVKYYGKTIKEAYESTPDITRVKDVKKNEKETAREYIKFRKKYL